MLRSNLTSDVRSLVSGPSSAMSRRNFLLWSGAALGMAGCAQVSYTPPVPDIAAAFVSGAPPRLDAAATRTWWQAFGDETLNGLVDAGMTRNLDVRQAVETINQARAATAGVAANDLPLISASGAAQRGDMQGISVTEASVAGRVMDD